MAKINLKAKRDVDKIFKKIGLRKGQSFSTKFSRINWESLKDERDKLTPYITAQPKYNFNKSLNIADKENWDERYNLMEDYN
ncbi:MAG: hypothetical protein Q8Q04_01330 [archaeon]|nr:hypothetical protein [archaeon]